MEDNFAYNSELGVSQATMRNYINGAKRATILWNIYVPLVVFANSLLMIIQR